MQEKALKQKRQISTKSIMQIAVMVALIAVLSQIWLPMPGGVPMTLQTLAVMLAGIILGPIKGGLAVLIYVAMGAIGLPVFTGFSGGFSVALGITGGYIMGFVVAAPIIGLLSSPQKTKKTLFFIKLLIGLLLGQAVIFSFGTLWIMRLSGMSLSAALPYSLIPFIVPEIIKTALAVVLGIRIEASLKIRR